MCLTGCRQLAPRSRAQAQVRDKQRHQPVQAGRSKTVTSADVAGSTCARLSSWCKYGAAVEAIGSYESGRFAIAEICCKDTSSQTSKECCGFER